MDSSNPEKPQEKSLADFLSGQAFDAKSVINTLRIRQEQEKLAILQLQHAKMRHSLRPSHCYPVTIRREGSNWVCILEHEDEITDCVVAYGGSPAQAMANFDAFFMGAGLELSEPDEDDEEQF